MTLKQVEYILALAEEKNFSKAAERLYMSQPALSQNISNIEKQVGMPLFDRTTSPIRMTAVGEIYVEIGRKLETTQNELERKVADFMELKTGRFIIGTSSFRASSLLPESICRFAEKYPGIKIDIETDHVSNLKQKLLNGDVDLCIDSDYFDSTSVHCEELFQETYYLAVPCNHVINNQWKDKVITAQDIIEKTDHFHQAKAVSLQECAQEPFVFMKKGSSFHYIFRKIFEEAEFEPNIHMQASQIETAFYWVNAGMALAMIPDTMICYGNYRNHPNYYKLGLPSDSQKVVVAVKRKRYVTIAIKEYIKLLGELIGPGT